MILSLARAWFGGSEKCAMTVAGLALLMLASCREVAIDASVSGSFESDRQDEVKSKPLVVLTWDEYFSEEVVSGFESENGIPVEFITFENLDEMEGLLRSRPSDFDLVVVDGGTLADLIELQLLQPIDHASIPSFDNLDEKFLGTKFDPDNAYSVPYMWGTTLVVYRSDKVGEPRKSWASLWDDQYKNRTLMLDDKFDVYAAALLAGGCDINTQNETEIARATDRLLEQVEKLDVRFVDIFEVREKLLSGECWISMTYSSDAAVLAEEEENISYFIPEEGAPLWVDSFVIPRESTNQDAAHRFLEYFCRPEVAAANSNELWSASVNQKARPLISKEVLDDPTIYLSEEVLSRCRFDSQTGPGRQLLVNQGLKRVFDRVREAERRPRVSLLIWEDYYDPEVIEKFETEHHCKVLITEVENTEQLKQELSGNPDGFDVVVADEVTLNDFLNLKQLRELDPALVGPRAEGSGEGLASPADPDNRFSMPYLWGLTVLAGRAEVMTESEPSWNLLWKEGLRTGILDEPIDLIWLSLLSLGYDPALATEAQVNEAAALIAKRFPDFTSHMRDTLSAVNALEAGELDLVVVYNGDALVRAARNPSIRVAIPKEGAPLWIDSLAVTRDSPQPELAHRLIAHLTSPAMSAMTANHLHFATPSLIARQQIDPDLLRNPMLYPDPEVMERCSFIQFPTGIQRAVSQSVARLVSGGRSRSIAMEEDASVTERSEKVQVDASVTED
jgi:spermidine/putrescine transport system substrate-binding protein